MVRVRVRLNVEAFSRQDEKLLSERKNYLATAIVFSAVSPAMAKSNLHPFRQWRLLQGSTLDECAVKLDISIGHLSAVERGSTKPSVALIAKMAKLTGGNVSQEQVLLFATREAA